MKNIVYTLIQYNSSVYQACGIVETMSNNVIHGALSKLKALSFREDQSL